jgi:predicted metal-dependent enzyme (double-stranded beta helix superfamily)
MAFDDIILLRGSPMSHLERRSDETPVFARPGRAGTLGALAAEISIACETPARMAVGIRAALERAVADPALLDAEQREPSAGCYARHVLYADPLGRFTILAIVWDAGQFSPSHCHDTWCAYAVYDGTLQETVYAADRVGSKAKPVCTEARRPGYSCFARAGLDQIHRLGNPGPKPAISIHVYGVERERIATHVNRLVDVAP